MSSPSIIDVNDPTSVRNGKEESSSVRIDRASEDEGCAQPASSLRNEKAQPPEIKLTLLAVKLALLEKTANGIGALNFIWATVVLLGGFAQTLESIDFWFVSIILMAEGVRLFTRSSEMETESASWCRSSLDSKKFFLVMNVFSILIQDYFPLACVIMSIYRLARQHYGDNDYPNRNRALNIFYGLSLAEEFMMLQLFCQRVTSGNYFSSLINPAELPETFSSRFLGLFCEGFWEARGSFSKFQGSLIWKTSKEYGFHESQVPMVQRFFSDAYSRCINGSISESLKMEFVSYGLELLQSSHSHDRLEGARLLSACMETETDRFTAERLSEIGTMRGLLETLIEMLNWDKLKEHEIRRVAAQIISKLVMIDRNLIRVMAIPESMESMASLLYDRNQIQIHSRHYGDQSSSLIQSRENGNQSTEEYPYSDFRLLGLHILTSLARKQEVRGIVGATGGVLHNLFSLFFMERNDNNDQTEEFVTKAGEALGFLSLENKQNCEIMMSINLGDHPNLIVSLISVLNDSVQGTHAARILWNLLAYAEIDCDELKEITASAAKVVVVEMEKQSAHQEHQEAIIGLAAQILKFMSRNKDIVDFDSVFQAQGAEIKTLLISKLVKVFNEHPHPSKEVPSITRFSLELLIAVMKMDRSTIEMRSQLKEVLEQVMKTTSELESYSTFSGTLGLSSHRMAIRSLVKSAMELLRPEDSG